MNFVCAFSIAALINSAIVLSYNQNDIKNAKMRMLKKEQFMKPLNHKFGCWPQNNTIPYIIGPGFTSWQRQEIMTGISLIQNVSCVRWIPKEENHTYPKYVRFNKNDGEKDCYARELWEGRQNGVIRAEVNYGDECFRPRTLVHEMLHALGFMHEQCRIDRDCYVVVNGAYAKRPSLAIIYDDYAFERFPYDKFSVMHYRRQPLQPRDRYSWFYVLKDIKEPFGGLIYKHKLGAYDIGWNEIPGILTYLDRFRINYRFCGAPHFCETQPKMCRDIEWEEDKVGCKKLYLHIINNKL